MAVQWERREQALLMQWFKLKYRNVLIAASANGGARNSKEAANMKREGVLAGMPDLQIFRAARGYNGLLIEMKTPATDNHAAGRVSMVQKMIMAQLEKENYYTAVCWGWVSAKSLIDWYLEPTAVNTATPKQIFIMETV